MHIHTDPEDPSKNGPQLHDDPARRQDTLLQRVTKAPARIWQSRISWRLAIMFFCFILLAQAGTLAITLKRFDYTGAVAENFYAVVVTALILSMIVTGLLILALSRWLLQPILQLRINLLAAAKNPEKPELLSDKNKSHDEIGNALDIANSLIRQNAYNLKKLRSQAEDKIHQLAYYDSLTGLPNRAFFMEKLEDGIKRKVEEGEGRMAVICLDVDHFKDINDTMGHDVGDALLEIISKRLVKCLPNDCLIARASSDEFVIMAPLRIDQPTAAPLVDKIFASMAEPVSLLQEKFQVRVSIGAAHCPEDGIDARSILKNADIALNRAKEEGRDTVRYYSQDFDVAVQTRFQMLRDLRVALDENHLQLYYHPQFDLKTGRIIGVEALLRWFRPDNSKNGGSLVPPLDFIPLAEESGLIVPIGEWVLKTACKTNKRWQEMGIPPFRVAVNISSVQFHRADLVRTVAEAIKESGLDPKYLELEVTEGVFMENMDHAIDVLNELHRQGVELAVDDFGTGYSSLNYLRHFPIDRLKIDQTFVRNALINPDDRTIACTIIALGHSLNLKVMAEGVETQDHEDFLRSQGCDEAQGFKYSKPIPEPQLREFVIEYNRNLAKTTKLAVVDERS